MAYTTIDDSSAHFQVDAYTGSSGNDSIVFDGNSDLQPDLLWAKNIDVAYHNQIHDSSRGPTNGAFYTNDSSAEGSAEIDSFDTDGWTGDSSNALIQGDGEDCICYGWKANGGTRTTFTESGANPGGGYQANTDAGFSIVDYTGTGSAGTVSHGLGVKPDFIIVKNRDADEDVRVYHEINTEAPETDSLKLNTTAATADDTVWNDTAPTTSVFSVGTDADVNSDGVAYIAYCWAGVQGFSHFGGFFGSGGANGPFVWTGFTPAFILIKEYTGTAAWGVWDHKRDTKNPNDSVLLASDSAVPYVGASYRIDFLSNGFKLRNTDGAWNGNGDYYLFAAFAAYPVVTSNGVPATAI